jgi:hypothetical protein
MNKYSFFLMPAVLFLFLPDSYQQKKNHTAVPEGISQWTGTVTRTEIITISNAAFNGKTEVLGEASFINALPTMYRDDPTTDLNFTDDKGPGRHKVHSEMTDLTGKKCIQDCEGNGQAELHSVVINEEANTYDIEVIFPRCIGTGNCSDNGQFEADALEGSVSDQPLGANKDVLSGTITGTSEIPGWGTMTATTTWHLERSKPEDVELIVTPEGQDKDGVKKNYNDWLPEPGINELKKGSIMTINLKLQGKNGKPLKEKVESFELHLNNTSSEPGITINYPIEPGPKQLPDLRFLVLSNIESVDEDQFISIGSPDGVTGKAYIGSYDGGGWTTLTAEAILKDSKQHIKGHLFVSGGDQEILIPKRDRGSNIASSWSTLYGHPGDKDDNDRSTGNENDGDGLSAFEEYRGVISMGQFKRLDPEHKDLGVMIKKNELSLFNDGISLFERASFIHVIRFSENEIDVKDRRLNRNFHTANVYKQYVERLENTSIPGDAIGENRPIDIIAKLPEQSELVAIDVSKIAANYRNQAAELSNYNRVNHSNLTMPYTELENRANTVAHELAHGVSVNHHGYPSNIPNLSIPKKSVDVYHVYDNEAREITIKEKQYPYPINGSIGEPHNDESGDLNCIMAYTSLYQWAKRVNNSINFYAVPILPMGKIFCTNKTGTGINSNHGYFDDARAEDNFGNCLSQMKLRD